MRLLWCQWAFWLTRLIAHACWLLALLRGLY
jgi:hypothetical protein